MNTETPKMSITRDQQIALMRTAKDRREAALKRLLENEEVVSILNGSRIKRVEE